MGIEREWVVGWGGVGLERAGGRQNGACQLAKNDGNVIADSLTSKAPLGGGVRLGREGPQEVFSSCAEILQKPSKEAR